MILFALHPNKAMTYFYSCGKPESWVLLGRLKAQGKMHGIVDHRHGNSAGERGHFTLCASVE